MAATVTRAEPTFGTADLAPLVDMTPETLSTLTHRWLGWAGGPGRHRLHTLDDAVRLVAAARLVVSLRGHGGARRGVGSDIAADAAAWLLDGPAEGVFVWDGRQASYGAVGVGQLLRQGFGVAAIDLDAIRTELLATA